MSTAYLVYTSELSFIAKYFTATALAYGINVTLYLFVGKAVGELGYCAHSSGAIGSGGNVNIVLVARSGKERSFSPTPKKTKDSPEKTKKGINFPNKRLGPEKVPS